jgi:hypothetical protein
MLPYLVFWGLLNYGSCQQTCWGSCENPAIAGRYTDNFGGYQIINQDTWNSTGMIFNLCFVENGAKELYAQNAGTNPYNPWLYSRFEWTTDAQHNLWYCQQVYNANSLEEAEEAPRANPSNPSVDGCGIPINNKTSPWTKLVPVLARPRLHYGSHQGVPVNQTCFGSNIVPTVAGRYTDNYGGYQIIDQWTWNSTGLIFHLCLVQNPDFDLIAQNDGNNGYYPWKYSRFEWTVDAKSKSLWYCQQVYNADTIQQAESAPRANPSNPSKGGCGIPANNFPWTQMIPVKPKHAKPIQGQTCFGALKKPTIAGRYTDNYGGTQIVSKKTWRSDDLIFHVCSVHNKEFDLIAQNDAHNQWYPLKYSRFEWVTVENSHTLWYCQQVYDADTAHAAETAPRADPSNPSVGGCGIPNNNFPWTQMIKVTNVAVPPSSSSTSKREKEDL